MKAYQNKSDTQAWENRYGVGFSQYLADQMAHYDRRTIDFLDVKELNDLVVEYRVRIRSLIAFYRAAKQYDAKPGSQVRRAYANQETALLKRQIAELRDLYRMAFLDSRTLTNEYLSRLKADGVTQMQFITEKTKAA